MIERFSVCLDCGSSNFFQETIFFMMCYKKNYSEEGFNVNGETTRWRIEKLVRSHDIVNCNDNQIEIRITKVFIKS